MKIADKIRDFLTENNISGCMILIQLDDEHTSHIAHAVNNIPEITLIKSLSKVILVHNKKTGGNNWNKLIDHAASDLYTLCGMIQDMISEAKESD